VSVEEPNPGRTAKSAQLRNQRRSVFMTALIGATVTAILAGAAAFRIRDANAKKPVKIVTTTTTVPRTSTTVDPADDTTFTTEFVPTTNASEADPITTTTKPATTTSSSTSTSTTSTTVVTAPPPTSPGQHGAPHIVWHLSPASATLQSGAQMTLIITATNAGNAGGTVNVPPCPAAPHAESVVRSPSGDPLSNACHSGPQTLSIAPGQHYNWTDTISATSDATRYGSALAPGNYLVLVTGSPSPAVYLHLAVRS
jgi:hypothetical protein